MLIFTFIIATIFSYMILLIGESIGYKRGCADTRRAFTKQSDNQNNA